MHSRNLDDHGSWAAVDRLAHPEEAEGVLDVLFVAQIDRGALPLDVGAGAEALALTREDDGTRIPDVRKRVGELRDQSRVERVAPLGTRQGYVQDGPVPLDHERAHGRELRVRFRMGLVAGAR